MTDLTIARREQARNPLDGRFGLQTHQDPGVVEPVHGDEIRAHLYTSVREALGGDWVIGNWVITHGAVDRPTIYVPALTTALATVGASEQVTRAIQVVLPRLPKDRVEAHASAIARAVVMDELYNCPELDQRDILSKVEDEAPPGCGLILTDREAFRFDGGLDWDAWAAAEADAWASERFSRSAAAVDESRRQTPTGQAA